MNCFGRREKDSRTRSLHATTQDEHRCERLDLSAGCPMMRCRMCSQRLPRPGKLCRECERELDRARLAANTVAGLAPLGPAFAPPTIEELPGEGASGARFRLRAPPRFSPGNARVRRRRTHP